MPGLVSNCRIGPINGPSSDDFIFKFKTSSQQDGVAALAPHRVQRTYAAVYAPVPVAFGDQIPEEWKGNSASEISLEFEIVGNGQAAITEQLRKLRKFMRKDRRTGEPPDLIFAMGSTHWTVRLHRLQESPVLWNANTDEQRTRVTATLHTLSWDD